MPRFVALYSRPNDPDGFDRHYREIHMPIVARWPRVQAVSVTRFTGSPMGGEPTYYLMFVAECATDDDLKAMLRSDAAREAVADTRELEKRYGSTLTVLTGTDF